MTMAVDHVACLADREMTDPTELEKGWGEMLEVPLYAADDSALWESRVGGYGKCIWKPQKFKHWGMTSFMVMVQALRIINSM